jgi:ATP-dependent Clp protease ATP-binding subunit ClpA
MMRGVASTMEKHHKVQILDEALEAAVKLSTATSRRASCPTRA